MWPPVSNLDDEPNRAYLRRVELLDDLPPPRRTRRRVDVPSKILRKVLRTLVMAGKLARRASRELGRRRR